MGASVSSMFSSHAAAYCMGTYTSGPISGTCISSAWGATNSVIVTALLLQHRLMSGSKLDCWLEALICNDNLAQGLLRIVRAPMPSLV